MRVSARRHHAIVVTALAIAACGTTLPESGRDAPSTTASGDASVATEDGSPGEIDGGTDATTDVIANGCTRVIDDPFTQLAMPPWTSKVENGGVVEHASGALHAEVGATSASTTAQVSREITGALPKSMRLAFGMRVSSAGSGYVELGCTLQLQGSDAQTFISFQPEIAGGNLAIDSTKKLDGASISTGAAEPVGPLDTAHWYAVDIQLADVTTAGAHATVIVDGVKRYERDATFPAPPGVVRLKCGIDYGSTGASASVFIDDVKLEFCE